MAARMILLALLALLVSPAAAALPDPTAPPSAQAADGTAGQALLPLTAIKRVGTRYVAIIGGQEIAVGGRYQDARIVRISESEVVLRRGQETVLLKLYPQVDKRPRGK
jgi:MSHA biogenesis protein MshK